MNYPIRNLLLSTATVLALGSYPALAQDAMDTEPAAATPAEEDSTAIDPATTEAIAGTVDRTETEIVSLPEWHPDIFYQDGRSVENILDMDVYGPTGEEIGDVENVIIGQDGKVESIISEVGGIWDIGDTHVNVPWNEVEFRAAGEGVTIPVTQETVEEFSLFPEDRLTASEANSNIQPVEGDGAGVVDTGPRSWRAAELINDYARINENGEPLNYGYVDDLIIDDGKVAAVVVRPDVAFGARGLYAYPFYGYGYGWNPGLDYYELPYERGEIADLQPFDEEKLETNG